MGYYTQVTGRLDIVPPLTYRELGTYVDEDTDDLEYLRIEVEKAEVDVEDGVLEIKRGVAILPRYEDSMRTYEIDTELQKLVNTFAAEGRVYRGVIDGQGEDATDRWKLIVREGHVIKLTAQVVWPFIPDEEDVEDGT